jgi:hypothetical protein
VAGFARGTYWPSDYISLHITSKASELGLGLGLLFAIVSVRVTPGSGTLQASRQIGPRAKWLTGVSGKGKLGLSLGRDEWVFCFLLGLAVGRFAQFS